MIIKSTVLTISILPIGFDTKPTIDSTKYKYVPYTMSVMDNTFYDDEFYTELWEFMIKDCDSNSMAE